MATGTAGSVARLYQASLVHYLRKTIAYTDEDNVITIGVIPAGSIVISAGIVVTTAFADTGTDVLDIGTADDPDGFATDLDISTVGNKVWDEFATSNDLYAATDTTIVAEYIGQNSNAAAGSGVVYVAYLPANG